MATSWELFTALMLLTLTVYSSAGEPVLYNSVTGCSSNIRLNPGNIIDIRASVERGAELLLGGWETSLSNCIASCCHMPRCDLVLYKNVGLSQSGRNCYFIHCGSSENCVTVTHEGFTSASITPTDEARVHDDIVLIAASAIRTMSSCTCAGKWELSVCPTLFGKLENRPSLMDQIYSTFLITIGTTTPTTDTGITSSPTPSDSTTSEPPHTTAPPTQTISQTVSETTMPAKMSTTMSTTMPTTMSTKMSTTTPSSTTVSAVSVTTGSPVTHTTTSTTNSPGDGGTQPVNTTESVNSNQANQQSPPQGETDIFLGNIVVPEDECSLDGCDGSGVIVVAVVGSICVMIIMVVIIVIMKRVLNDKKKKRFRNVDYLINGMYT